MEEIRIIRLKSGDDVIGVVSDIDENKINVRYPMVVDIMDSGTHQSYVIQSWLPHQMFQHNEVDLFNDDILFVASATDKFIEYYSQMVEKLEKYITSSEIMTHLEEEEELIEVMNEKASNIVH